MKKTNTPTHEHTSKPASQHSSTPKKKRPCGAAALVVLSLIGSPAVLAQRTAPADGGGAAEKAGLFASFPTPVANLPLVAPAWPQRWGRAGEKIQGVVIDMDPAVRLASRRGFMGGDADSSEDVKALKLGAAADAKASANSGDKADAKRAPGFAWERPGSFMYFPVPAKEGDPPRKNQPSMEFRFVSGEVEVGRAEDPRATVRLQRTWFQVFDADSGQKARLRGVALVMPGLFGTPEGTLSGLTTALRKDGWMVLRMVSQPSRFTEQVEFELNAGGDLAAQARHIAEVFDDRGAECAYAAQAAFAHLEEKRPELKGLPRIAVGFSGGAMTLPTVVAREPERYKAAVMVGGGADFWLMNERSNYKGMIDAVHEKWDQPPTPEQLAKLDGLYLGAASLDSYHTAATLKGKKVLMVQGSADLAVPSPLGDLLWERLGKPERWIVDGAGHEVLFMTLPGKFGKIVEWLRGDGPAPGAAAEK